MLDFSISQLIEFTTLVGTLNYSETADKLNISTSALTRHIQVLEKELGEQLFARTSRTVELTDFGRVFLPHAVMILQDYETGIKAIENFEQVSKRFLHLGVYYSMIEYDIDKFIARFKGNNPDYNISLTVGGMAELEKCFREKSINIYTAVDGDGIQGFNFIKASSAVFKAVVSENSPLALKKTLSLAETAEHPVLIPEKNSMISKTVFDAFKAASITPNVIFSGRFEESLDFIRDQDCVALFSFRIDRPIKKDGFVFIDTDPEICFDYGIGYRDELTQPEKAFLEASKSVIADYF